MKRENDRHMAAAGFRLSAWRRRADGSSRQHRNTYEDGGEEKAQTKEGSGGRRWRRERGREREDTI